MKAIKKIQKVYPGSEQIFIVERFIQNKGWEKTLPNFPADQTIEHLKELGVSKVNIQLVDEFGQIRNPDFSISELSN